MELKCKNVGIKLGTGNRMVYYVEFVIAMEARERGEFTMESYDTLPNLEVGRHYPFEIDCP